MSLCRSYAGQVGRRNTTGSWNSEARLLAVMAKLRGGATFPLGSAKSKDIPWYSPSKNLYASESPMVTPFIYVFFRSCSCIGLPNMMTSFLILIILLHFNTLLKRCKYIKINW